MGIKIKDARIDADIAKVVPFTQPILTHIRSAVHAGCPEMQETLMWRHPAFMYKGILCGMAAFKQHVTFGFWKASAMNGVGEKANEAAGQFGRITSMDDLPDSKTFIGLVKEAAALHDQGVTAPRTKSAPKKPLKRRQSAEIVMRTALLVSLLSISLLAAIAVRAAEQHEHAMPEKLGRVHFDTSCSKQVADRFDRAVALLHSFQFSAAKRAFEEVAAADPSCAMAHWGIAMTFWGNPFAGLKPATVLADGHRTAEKARATGTPTARERAYIAAVSELFNDFEKLDQRTRVLAYERAMEQVYRNYPDDSEAAAFYALAVNQTALPTDKTYAQQLKAAAILEKLFAAQPEHPGLAHYIIHAFDHPPLASRALDAARRYSKIAPSAPHALHMPSHTFTRVGYWEESIDTNRASAEAAVRDKLFAEALHALDYQTYAYLQSGQDAAAQHMVDEAPRLLSRLDPKAMGGAAPGIAGQYAAAAIPARYAMERGKWSDAAALTPATTGIAYVDAVTRFARALGAARTGQVDAARQDAAELRTLSDKLAAMKDAYWAEQVNIQHQVASAWIAFAEGRKPEALAMLQKAATAEDATDKSAISPGPLAPARELLGEMLLALDRPADARTEFEATMKKEPNRFRATYFAGKSALMAGDREGARQHFKHVLDVCKRADASARPELQEARKLAGS